MTDGCDIVIAGGGPAGAAFALALRDSGHRICVVEPRATPPADDEDTRNLALTHGSRLILERLGVWDTLTATPITAVLVSQQRAFGRAEFTAAEAGVPALGYVVRHAQLRRALTAALDRSGARVLYGHAVRGVEADAAAARVRIEGAAGAAVLEAKLLAVADGGAGADWAEVKVRRYRDVALVCDVASQQPHLNRAFERFTSDGPLALLPMSHGWSLVWIGAPARTQALAALDPGDFCREVKAVCGMLGEFTLLGPRQTFPLTLKYAMAPRTPRTALIGNAAQTLHPVAAQGFNLGLRDAWELARTLVVRHVGDPGTAAVLDVHRHVRRRDRIATIAFTDSLIRLFSNDIPLLRDARGAGLVALGALTPVKKLFLRRMLFGARG
ncbi:MAG TPA: FAD-dependent monooxygenase [Burkholderiales bacterium]|nr:FAD-dependent monooxygenase [Burkholderiales bacterium]